LASRAATVLALASTSDYYGFGLKVLVAVKKNIT